MNSNKLLDSLPNEVLRMILDHLDRHQRKSIMRVSVIWAYLTLTYPRVPLKYSYDRCINIENVYHFGTIRYPYYSDDLFVCENNTIKFINKKGYCFKEIILEEKYYEIHNIIINGKKQNIIVCPIIYGHFKGIVHVYDYDGKLIKTPYIEFSQPAHVDIDNQTGNIIIHELNNNRIRVYDCNCEMIFENNMIRHVMFDSYSIAINQKNKNMIKCLSNCSKVEIFDKDNKYLSTFEYTNSRLTNYFHTFISISDDFFVCSVNNISNIVDFMGNLICTIDYNILGKYPDIENLIILSDGTIIMLSRSYDSEHKSFIEEMLFFKPHY